MKIEKDVPTPVIKTIALRDVLREMQPGESVFYPYTDKAYGAVVHYVGYQKKWAFISRAEGNGRRIWRTA